MVSCGWALTGSFAQTTHDGAGMQNTSHYSQTLNVRVPRHGRAYCRELLVSCVRVPSPSASLTSLSFDPVLLFVLVRAVIKVAKVCASLDQNWQIQWVCSGKQD